MNETKKPIKKLEHYMDLEKEMGTVLFEKEYFDEELLDTNKYKDVNELNKTFVDVMAKTNNEKSKKILVDLENKDSLFANINSVRLKQLIIGNIMPTVEKIQLKEQNYTVQKEYKPKEYPTINTYPSSIEVDNQFKKLDEDRKRKKEEERQELLKQFAGPQSKAEENVELNQEK